MSNFHRKMHAVINRLQSIQSKYKVVKPLDSFEKTEIITQPDEPVFMSNLYFSLEEQPY